MFCAPCEIPSLTFLDQASSFSANTATPSLKNALPLCLSDPYASFLPLFHPLAAAMIFRLRVLFTSVLACGVMFAAFRWRTNNHRAARYLGSTYRMFNSSAHLPLTDYAIATFLTGQANDDDSYFTSTRVLAHQLLHAPATRSNRSSITFLVLCSQSVPRTQKETLRDDGAAVIEVRDVPVAWWIHSGVTRWAEQFTKLRVFEMTEYKRILFIDADTLITRPLDGIFFEPDTSSLAPTLSWRKDQKKWGESELPREWFFGARSDNAFTGERDHVTPPLQTVGFSAGFFMVAPDRKMYEYLMSVMANFRRFDPFTMEQSLLNYVFRREGMMPWIELSWQWSATWPNEKDVELGVASLHEKLWRTGPQALKDLWNRKKGEMLQFHEKRALGTAA